jgi:D-proline reductase (dithiol) PrdB
MSDADTRAAAANTPLPTFDSTPFTQPPPLADARVAIVTTAALHTPDQATILRDDHTFRVLEDGDELLLGHTSPNFDRTGWLYDPNVVMPLDRLREFAADGTIRSVAPRQISFAGNQRPGSLTTIRLDSGPAAAKLLREDGVDVVLLTPV